MEKKQESQIEIIKEEYRRFIPQNKNITSKEELLTYLQIGIDDIEESILGCKEEQRLNKKEQLHAKIRNFFFFLFEQEEIEYYDEDNELLQKSINFSKKYLKVYQEIVPIVTDDNFQELYKLVEFSTYYYNRNVDYLNDEARQLELSYQGIYFYSNQKDTQEELFLFLKEELQKYNKEKNLAKVKK